MYNPEEVVNKLNNYIKKGIITFSEDQKESLLCLVWGLRQAEFNGLVWREVKGRFIGGGIYSDYYYTLTRNGQVFKTSNYITSLRMFLNYVEKAFIKR